jgi:hypothetical protein
MEHRAGQFASMHFFFKTSPWKGSQQISEPLTNLVTNVKGFMFCFFLQCSKAFIFYELSIINITILACTDALTVILCLIALPDYTDVRCSWLNCMITRHKNLKNSIVWSYVVKLIGQPNVTSKTSYAIYSRVCTADTSRYSLMCWCVHRINISMV